MNIIFLQASTYGMTIGEYQWILVLQVSHLRESINSRNLINQSVLTKIVLDIEVSCGFLKS